MFYVFIRCEIGYNGWRQECEEFCSILSIVVRKEVCITATSEYDAMNRVKQFYESGHVVIDSSNTKHVNIHPEYLKTHKRGGL